MYTDACEAVFAERFPFWEKLTAEQRDRLCRHTTAVRFAGGQNIHGAGGDCTGAVFIRSGQARAYMLSEEGREITLYRLFAGDLCMLSASCVLRSITFDVFLDALEETDAFIINPGVIAQLCDECVWVDNFCLQMATERFSDVMWAMQQILFMRFDRRLAVFLLDELSKTGGDTVRLTQEQIARYIGSAREVVSRMLREFAGDGTVEVSRGGVRVLDRAGLRRRAGIGI